LGRWLSAQKTDEKDGRREVLAADFFEWVKGVVGQWDVLLDYTYVHPNAAANIPFLCPSTGLIGAGVQARADEQLPLRASTQPPRNVHLLSIHPCSTFLFYTPHHAHVPPVSPTTRPHPRPAVRSLGRGVPPPAGREMGVDVERDGTTREDEEDRGVGRGDGRSMGMALMSHAVTGVVIQSIAWH